MAVPGVAIPPSIVVITSVVNFAPTRTDTKTLESLVTPFIAPPECSSRWLLITLSDTASITSGYVGNTALASGIDQSYWRPCHASRTPIYSPGLCYGDQTMAIVQPQIQIDASKNAQTQWQALCCPSGMFPVNFRQCQSIFSTPFTVLAPVRITPDPNGVLNTVTFWDELTTRVSTTVLNDGSHSVVTKVSTIRSETVLSSGTLWAEPVMVYWKSSDLSRFPRSYATSLAAALNIDFPARLSASSAPNAQTGGISKGEIAAITSGAIIAAGVLGGVIIFFLIRRQRRKKVVDLDVPEMSGQGSGFKRLIAGRWRAEADGTSEPVEIDSAKFHFVELEGSRAELEGSPVVITEDIQTRRDPRDNARSE